MHTKERNGAVHPSYINYRLKSEVSIMFHYRLPLHSSMNQELLEKHLCNQNSHYENMDDFHYKGKPSRATTKSTLYAVSKDECYTKEDTGKSMKNALYVLQYAKRHLLDQSVKQKKIKPVALAVIELRLSEGISQSVSQLLSQ